MTQQEKFLAAKEISIALIGKSKDDLNIGDIIRTSVRIVNKLEASFPCDPVIERVTVGFLNKLP